MGYLNRRLAANMLHGGAVEAVEEERGILTTTTTTTGEDGLEVGEMDVDGDEDGEDEDETADDDDDEIAAKEDRGDEGIGLDVSSLKRRFEDFEQQQSGHGNKVRRGE